MVRSCHRRGGPPQPAGVLAAPGLLRAGARDDRVPGHGGGGGGHRGRMGRAAARGGAAPPAAEQDRQDQEHEQQGDQPQEAAERPAPPPAVPPRPRPRPASLARGPARPGRPGLGGPPRGPAPTCSSAAPGHRDLRARLGSLRPLGAILGRSQTQADESSAARRVTGHRPPDIAPSGRAREDRRTPMARIPGRGLTTGRVAALAAAIVAVAVLLLVLSVVHVLPRLRNPFTETTTERDSPVVLKSITQLSRYEAASGSFQVVVDLTKKTSFLPSFLAGSQTLFIGVGSDIAFVDFAGLKGRAISVSPDRTSVTVTLPRPQLEPAQLNVKQSYVFAEQQGLADRLSGFLGGNPNSQ